MWDAIQSLLSNVSTLVARKKEMPAERPSRRNSSPSPRRITVSGVVADVGDRATLSKLNGEWHVHLEDALDYSNATLGRFKSPVILWDRDLPCEDWRDVVHQLAALPHRPCVLLLSRVVDDYLWNEVVACGGYDVLPKPLREVEMTRAVRLAWSYWASTANTPSGSVKPPRRFAGL